MTRKIITQGYAMSNKAWTILLSDAAEENDNYSEVATTLCRLAKKRVNLTALLSKLREDVEVAHLYNQVSQGKSYNKEQASLMLAEKISEVLR